MQGPTGRPGMIGQPGVVGEKVKEFTLTTFACLLFDTTSLFLDFSHIIFCCSQGEDGEAGDPGSAGVPGRIVSLLAPFKGHIFISKTPFDWRPPALAAFQSTFSSVTIV